jgi:hypothetical protein
VLGCRGLRHSKTVGAAAPDGGGFTRGID